MLGLPTPYRTPNQCLTQSPISMALNLNIKFNLVKKAIEKAEEREVKIRAKELKLRP